MRALQTVVTSTIAFLLASTMVPVAAAQNAAAGAAQVPAANAQSAPSSTETQSVHVQVGRSIILNTQARLRRIVVSDPAVLSTTVVSPTQVVVTAKSPGSSSLLLWDEHSNSRIVDVYSDIDISGLRGGIHDAYPAEPIDVQSEEGRIVLSGTVSSKKVADGAVALAEVYSKNVVNSMIVKPQHEKQIMLKVEFAEVDRTKLRQFGLNILSTGAAGNIGSVTTGQYGGSTTWNLENQIGAPLSGFKTTVPNLNPLNIFLFRPDLNLGATLQALQQKSVLQILARPNLMALNGQPAKFLAGGEFPFPVVQGVSSGTTAVTIQFKKFGVQLAFTGTIEGNKIRLKLAPEVSTLDYTNAVTISGFQIPAISTRRAETVIELADGQTFGMAGLLDKRETVQLSKMPGIGDIPILGQLFRSHQINRTNSELMVLVTPIIIDPAYQQTASAAPPARAVNGLNTKKFDKSLRGYPLDDKKTPQSK